MVVFVDFNMNIHVSVPKHKVDDQWQYNGVALCNHTAMLQAQ